MTGFRLNASARATQSLMVDGDIVEFDYDPTPPGGRFDHGFMDIHTHGSQFVQVEGSIFEIRWPRTSGNAAGTAGDGAILAPMPGRVTAVEVVAGDTVTKGQRLVTLEAMKMEHSLTAPFDGTVAELNAEAGAQVNEGTVLVRVEKAE